MCATLQRLDASLPLPNADDIDWSEVCVGHALQQPCVAEFFTLCGVFVNNQV
jgi:hypothetical protein